VRLAPISRKAFIKRLRRELDWEGPYQPAGRKGGKHPYFMKRGDRILRLPNEHGGAMDVDLLKKLLNQAGITRGEWTGGTDDADREHANEDEDRDQPEA